VIDYYHHTYVCHFANVITKSSDSDFSPQIHGAVSNEQREAADRGPLPDPRRFVFPQRVMSYASGSSYICATRPCVFMSVLSSVEGGPRTCTRICGHWQGLTGTLRLARVFLRGSFSCYSWNKEGTASYSTCHAPRSAGLSWCHQLGDDRWFGVEGIYPVSEKKAIFLCSSSVLVGSRIVPFTAIASCFERVEADSLL